jgi:hypothetical protein
MDFPYDTYLEAKHLAEDFENPHLLGGMYLTWLIDRALLDAQFRAASRVGRHPVTGETVEQPSKRELAFTPDRALLERLERP